MLVAVVAILAAGTLQPGRLRATNDIPDFTHPFGNSTAGHVADHLLTPLARWDTVWYVMIAQSGYVGSPKADDPGLPSQKRVSFFPAYPLAMRVVSGFSKSPRRLLPAALLISLASFLGALWLLYRLAELERGPSVGRAAVYLLAFSPMAFFFSAPYTESLFLLLTIGSFYAARRERWWVAGLLAAVASATRNMGILLFLPLAIMYFFPRGRPRRPLRAEAAFLLLVPLGLLAYSWHLHHALGDFLAWAHLGASGAARQRHFVGPFSAFKDAVVDTGNALGTLGDRTLDTGGFQMNLIGMTTLLVTLAATVGVYRELGAAYASYTLAGALWPLFAPNIPVLLSYPRFATALFPLFIWLAIVCERRKITTPVVATFSVLLALFTAEFVSWYFVA